MDSHFKAKRSISNLKASEEIDGVIMLEALLIGTFTLVFIFALVTAQEAPLNQWYIAPPIFSRDSLELFLDYPISDYIPYENINWRIYDGRACRDGATDITENNFLFISEETEEGAFDKRGDGTAFRNLIVGFEFDPLTIRDSPIFSEVGLDAYLNFCVQISAFLGDHRLPDRIELFTRQTFVSVEISQEGGFRENVTVIPEDITEVGDNETYRLVGYLCDDDNVEILDPEAIWAGMSTKVCVTPDERARDAGMYMRAIDSFVWSRETISQTAIFSHQKAALMTDVDCVPGMLICSFKTILKMPFYYTEGFVDGGGIGWMQFGTDSNATMAGASSVTTTPPRGLSGLSRMLQNATDGGGEGDGEVSLNATGGEGDGEGSLNATDGGEDDPGEYVVGYFQVAQPVQRLYDVVGYLCHGENNEEIKDPLDYPLVQGDVARVCVRPNNFALSWNIKMRRIESFKWSNGKSEELEQIAIRPNSNSTAEPSTTVSCIPGEILCTLETELMDSFFLEREATTRISSIFGEGVAWLQFEDGLPARRTMIRIVPPQQQTRHLQSGSDLGVQLFPTMEPGFAGASPFSVVVYILSATNLDNQNDSPDNPDDEEQEKDDDSDNLDDPDNDQQQDNPGNEEQDPSGDKNLDEEQGPSEDDPDGENEDPPGDNNPDEEQDPSGENNLDEEQDPSGDDLDGEQKDPPGDNNPDDEEQDPSGDDQDGEQKDPPGDNSPDDEGQDPPGNSPDNEQEDPSGDSVDNQSKDPDVEDNEQQEKQPPGNNNSDDNPDPDYWNRYYNCRAYECDANLVEFVSGDVRTQNSTLRICVTPTEVAKDAGARMWSINWWTWSQGRLSQPAVEEQGMEASRTLLNCVRGSPICHFETRLIDEFFWRETNALNGNGHCWLTFGGEERFQGDIKKDDNLDPAEDPLYAGESDLKLQFSVSGNWTDPKFECPKEEHDLRLWWENEDEDFKTLVTVAVVGTGCSLCCVLFCCLVMNIRRGRSTTYYDEEGNNLIVNVDIDQQASNVVHEEEEHIQDYRMEQHLEEITVRSPKEINFADDDHPGTRRCRKLIRRYIREHPDHSYGPEAFKAVKRQLGRNTLFLVDYDGTEASKREILSSMGKIWKLEKIRQIEADNRSITSSSSSCRSIL
eukprot:scaffold22680_cov107-Cylindrotheca_fusiformis.AAC.15